MPASDRRQGLRILEDRFLIEHDDGGGALPDGGWLSVVRGPDGRTVVRRAEPDEPGVWAAFWSGDEPHDPQATGMLSALVEPLAAAGLPVMVASTFHADLVLVPADRLA